MSAAMLSAVAVWCGGGGGDGLREKLFPSRDVVLGGSSRSGRQGKAGVVSDRLSVE
jgi:hypothetical protein